MFEKFSFRSPSVKKWIEAHLPLNYADHIAFERVGELSYQAHKTELLDESELADFLFATKELPYRIDPAWELALSFYQLLLCEKTKIVLQVDASLLESVAKLRAFQVLKEKLLVAGILKTEQIKLCAYSRRSDFTAHDHKNNSLRSMLHAFVTITTGADYFCSAPSDLFLESKNPLNQRLLENTLHVLKDESHLESVSDPFAGSYLIENKCQKIIDQFWVNLDQLQNFTDWNAVTASSLYKEIKQKSFTQEENRVKNKQVIIAGVNDYFNPDENLKKEDLTKDDFVRLNCERERISK